MPVGGDAAALVERDARRFQVQPVEERAASGRDEHDVGLELFGGAALGWTTPPPEDFFAHVTFVLSLNLKPCFVSERWNAFLISPSIVGTMLGRNSTTVTSEPRRDQTEP